MILPKSWKEYLETRPAADLPLPGAAVLAVLHGDAVHKITWDELMAEMRALDEKRRVVIASGPVIVTDRIIIIDATMEPIDLTFISASFIGSKGLKVMRSRADPGDNAVRLLPSPAQTIAGEAEISLLPGEGYEYIPDGVADYLQF